MTYRTKLNDSQQAHLAAIRQALTARGEDVRAWSDEDLERLVLRWYAGWIREQEQQQRVARLLP